MKKARNKTHSAAAEDMPEDVSQQQGWQPARYRADPIKARVPKRRVTINLDEDIVAIFKAEAMRGGPPYQVAINEALRAYLRDRERSSREAAAETVLKALDDEEVVRRIRRIR